MPPWQCYQDILLQPGGNEDLSLALPHQLSLPIEFARFAQMCITLDNQARMRKTTPSRLVPPSLFFFFFFFNHITPDRAYCYGRGAPVCWDPRTVYVEDIFFPDLPAKPNSPPTPTFFARLPGYSSFPLCHHL